MSGTCSSVGKGLRCGVDSREKYGLQGEICPHFLGGKDRYFWVTVSGACSSIGNW